MKKIARIFLFSIYGLANASRTTELGETTCYSEKPITIETSIIPIWLLNQISWKYQHWFLIEKQATNFRCRIIQHDMPISVQENGKSHGAYGTTYMFGDGTNSRYGINTSLEFPIPNSLENRIEISNLNGEPFQEEMKEVDGKKQTCYRSINYQFCIK